MRGLGVVIALVANVKCQAARADTVRTDVIEVELGVGEARLEPGICRDGGFNGPCDPGWNGLARLGVARGRWITSWLALIGRGTLDGVFMHRDLALLRAFVGGGARVEALDAHVFVDLMVGFDFQFGSTGTGESGLAEGPSVGPELRVGGAVGNWFVAVEAIAMPLNRGTLGLDSFDVVLAAGHRW
jgi:hypothetical protein